MYRSKKITVVADMQLLRNPTNKKNTVTNYLTAPYRVDVLRGSQMPDFDMSKNVRNQFISNLTHAYMGVAKQKNSNFRFTIEFCKICGEYDPWFIQPDCARSHFTYFTSDRIDPFIMINDSIYYPITVEKYLKTQKITNVVNKIKEIAIQSNMVTMIHTVLDVIFNKCETSAEADKTVESALLCTDFCCDNKMNKIIMHTMTANLMLSSSELLNCTLFYTNLTIVNFYTIIVNYILCDAYIRLDPVNDHTYKILYSYDFDKDASRQRVLRVIEPLKKTMASQLSLINKTVEISTSKKHMLYDIDLFLKNTLTILDFAYDYISGIFKMAHVTHHDFSYLWPYIIYSGGVLVINFEKNHRYDYFENNDSYYDWRTQVTDYCFIDDNSQNEKKQNTENYNEFEISMYKKEIADMNKQLVSQTKKTEDLMKKLNHEESAHNEASTQMVELKKHVESLKTKCAELEQHKFNDEELKRNYNELSNKYEHIVSQYNLKCSHMETQYSQPPSPIPSPSTPNQQNQKLQTTIRDLNKKIDNYKSIITDANKKLSANNTTIESLNKALNEKQKQGALDILPSPKKLVVEFSEEIKSSDTYDAIHYMNDYISKSTEKIQNKLLQCVVFFRTVNRLLENGMLDLSGYDIDQLTNNQTIMYEYTLCFQQNMKTRDMFPINILITNLKFELGRLHEHANAMCENSTRNKYEHLSKTQIKYIPQTFTMGSISALVILGFIPETDFIGMKYKYGTANVCMAIYKYLYSNRLIINGTETFMVDGVVYRLMCSLSEEFKYQHSIFKEAQTKLFHFITIQNMVLRNMIMA